MWISFADGWNKYADDLFRDAAQLTHRAVADYAEGQDERLCFNPYVYVLL
jgi:hypothetical protein